MDPDAGSFPRTARFQRRCRLGAGGMGVVYEAWDEEQGARVALKTLPSLDASALYDFKQEFRALADITHPNLIALYELLAEDDRWFFTMEFVDGVDFVSHVRPAAARARASEAVSPLPAHDAQTSSLAGSMDADQPAVFVGTADVVFTADPERLRGALRQLADALCAVHAAGKLHRDIKPSNVLVTAPGRVVVLDFGLVADLDRADAGGAQGDVSGTIPYMSPEQAEGRRLTEASDWYAVGAMLYEALTGRPPFVGTALSVLTDKRSVDPAPPSAHTRGVPDDLERLCLDLLRRDPAARPGGQEILRRLGGAPEQALASFPRAAVPAPFVGRETELEQLTEALTIVESGRGAVACVSGASGVGKSALVQTFLQRIAPPDVLALYARCYEQESVPYKGVDGLIDALTQWLQRQSPEEVASVLPRDIRALAQLFPVLGRVPAIAQAPARRAAENDPHERRRLAFQAFRELLARLGDRTRLVIAVDDLQWGDAETAHLLAEVLHSSDRPVLLMIAGYRSEYVERSPCLRIWLEALGRERVERRDLRLQPLSVANSRRLAAALMGSDSPDAAARAEAVARESGGNAYFVLELARSASAAGGRIPDAGAAAGRTGLDDFIWERVRRLAPDARRLLEIIAVSGRPLSRADACAAGGFADGRPAALSVLRQQHLVRSTGLKELDEIEPYHDRVRETLVERMLPDVRAGHHGRLARVLETSGRADPETLGVHFEQAGDRSRAGRHYAVAADQAAAAVAFGRAVTLYRRALEMGGFDAEAERMLRVALADALANAGWGVEAARAYEACAAEATGAARLAVERKAAYQYCISGHLDDGRRAFGQVLGRIGLRLPGGPLTSIAALLAARGRLMLRGLRYTRRDEAAIPRGTLDRIDTLWAVGAGLGVVDIAGGAHFTARGLLEALQAGEPYRIARALAWEAAVEAAEGRFGRRRSGTLIDACRPIAAGVASPHARAMLAASEAIITYLHARWKEAEGLLRRAETILTEECTGVAWELATVRTFQLWNCISLGTYAELSLLAPRLLTEAEDRGDLYTATNIGGYMYPNTLLAADRPVDAREAVDRSLARWSQKGYQLQHLMADLARGWIALYSGDGGDAWRIVNAMWPKMRRSLFDRNDNIRIFVTDLRARSALAAALQAPDRTAYLRSARRDAASLEREDLPHGAAMAETTYAGLAALEGDRGTAAARLEKGAAGFDALDMRLFAAAARWRLGRIVAGARGAELTAAAEAVMRAEKIVSPERWAAMHIPGVAT